MKRKDGRKGGGIDGIEGVREVKMFFFKNKRTNKTTNE